MIQDFKKEKHELEMEILKLIADFENKWKVAVTGLDLYCTGGRDLNGLMVSVPSKVKVEVDI